MTESARTAIDALRAENETLRKNGTATIRSIVKERDAARAAEAEARRLSGKAQRKLHALRVLLVRGEKALGPLAECKMHGGSYELCRRTSLTHEDREHARTVLAELAAAKET